MAKQQENANPRISKPGKFIPTFGGNHERPNPVTFHYPRITRAMRRKYSALRVVVGDKVVPAAGILIAEECCRVCVTKVENCTDDNGAEITDGEELAEHGSDEYIQEFYVWVEKGLTFSDVEKKILGRSSGSSPPDTRPSNGTAGDAGPEGTINDGAVDLEAELTAQS